MTVTIASLPFFQYSNTKTTAAIIIIITITIIIIKLVVCSRRADYHSVNRQQ